MGLRRVYVKLMWMDRELYNSYYLLRADSDKDAREKARERVLNEIAEPWMKRNQLSVRTSLKGFVK